MSDSRLSSLIAGFVLGAAAGATLALLLAPAPGKETRERLREQGPKLGSRGLEAAQVALARCRRAADDSRARLLSTVETARARLHPEEAFGPSDKETDLPSRAAE